VIAAVRSEWRKLLATRSLVVLVVLSIAAAGGLAVLVASVVPLSDLAGEGLESSQERSTVLVGGMGIARFLIGSLGVLVIGQEFRFATIRVTFTAEPRRGRVLAAKAIVVSAVSLVTALVGIVIAIGAGAAILSARGSDVAVGDADVIRTLVGWVLTTVLYGLAGLALGTVLRQPVGGIVLLVAWRMLVETIIGGVFPRVGAWLPFSAADTVLAVVASEGPGPVGWWGVGYLAAVIAALAAAGAVLLQRRDA
jgi:ABC-2 type transport system permease protein